MNKKLKKFKIADFICGILFAISFAVIFFKINDQWMELALTNYILNLSVTILFMLMIILLSIIVHELGHLIFGINAKLKFIYFNVLGFTISKEKNRMIFKKNMNSSLILGSCCMKFDREIKYNEKKIILYFLGGIIFNFLLSIVTIFLFLISKSFYLKNILIFCFCYNIYCCFNNLIPKVTQIGFYNDMMHIINYKTDKNYLQKMSIFSEILSKGDNLTIEQKENLIHFPEKINNNLDVEMLELYISNLLQKKEYKKANDLITDLLKVKNDFLLDNNINSLKVSLLEALFYGNYELSMFGKYWDKSLEKYLELMNKVDLQSIGYLYLYFTLIEKNISKSEKYLSLFEKIIKKYPHMKGIIETKNLINEVKKRSN